MPLAHVHSRALAGVNAPPVTIEVHLSNGLPALSIVGLPEAAVRESKDRVRSAIINSGFEFPTRRITINLAPADLPKEGGRFDLPIAVGILAASGQIEQEILPGYEFYGELSLGGALQGVNGILPSVVEALAMNKRCIVPESNRHEAALVQQAGIFPASHLLEVTRHLQHGNTLHAVDTCLDNPETRDFPVDMADVYGQQQAKRALEIAAAGQHSLIFIGPPGTGKSMLAERLPTIMPPMTDTEALESAIVRSLINDEPITPDRLYRRPFRAPHHTASSVALVGGGSYPRPGEISLAHNGVLFLDELPEFERRVLDSLREPLETGSIMISRAARQALFPANVQLIGAMNPCPCGYLGDPLHACTDTPDQVNRYRSRLTGPFLDRIDLLIEVPRQARSQRHEASCETSASVCRRVTAARDIQLQRSNTSNARLSAAQLKRDCRIDADCQSLLQDTIDRLGLSSRAHDRILRVARTIADLDGSGGIHVEHLAEAIGYRRFTI